MKLHSSLLLSLTSSTLLLLPSRAFSETTASLSPNDFLVTGLEEIQPAFGEFDGEMYAGRIRTSREEQDDDGKLMFWLYTSKEDSLTIWLNGGPGCSSFGGMLFENAPVTIDHYPAGRLHTPSSPTLEPNQQSWTHATSMLYVEQPAGTGFSEGRMPKNETEVASDFYGFLSNFYDVFPEMKTKDLYIFGESYAGMYVPSIARKIHQENKKQENNKIPLAGIALGNGWIDATVQAPAVIDYAWWHGMIDIQTKNSLQAQLQTCLETGQVMDDRLHPFTTPDECGTKQAVQAAAGKGVTPDLSGPNIYDVTTWDSYPFIFDHNATFYRFFNDPKVQEILHAPVGERWDLCLPGEGRRRRLDEQEKMLDHDQPVSVVPYIAELLDDAKIRVLMYNGDRDMSCCAQGTETLLNSMEWSGSEEWKSAERGVWLVDNEPAGYSRITKNLEFVVVYNSGHLVPMNQPENALDLVMRTVNGRSFFDEKLPVFEAPPKVNESRVSSMDQTGTSSKTKKKNEFQKHRRQHTGLLVVFSMVIGFIAGVYGTIRYEYHRRVRGYKSVPEAEITV